MTVEIKIYGETALDAVRELRDISENLVSDARRAAVSRNAPSPLVLDRAGFLGQPPADNDHVAEGASPFPTEEDPAQVLAETNFAPTGAAKPARERGKPSPGHARRTKAEIAEDDAAALKLAETEGASDEVLAALSTGETVAEDSPEVQAADAADEAAETAAAKAPDAAPTVEDIRNVLGVYQKVYGLPATMEDGPKILSEVCGDGVVKVSAVPDDKIAAVIAALKKAGNENRFGRTAVAS